MSDVIILATLLFLTLVAHTDCQLSSFLYHYSVSHCQPTQVVNYYYCSVVSLLFLTLSIVSPNPYTYCQQSSTLYLHSLLHCQLTQIVRECRLKSFLYHYSFSHCQRKQIVGFHHPGIFTLCHTESILSQLSSTFYITFFHICGQQAFICYQLSSFL